MSRSLKKGPYVEDSLLRAHSSFTVASALMSPEMLEQALLYPKQSVELDYTFQNIMSVNVPQYQFHTKSANPGDHRHDDNSKDCQTRPDLLFPLPASCLTSAFSSRYLFLCEVLFLCRSLLLQFLLFLHRSLLRGSLLRCYFLLPGSFLTLRLSLSPHVII